MPITWSNGPAPHGSACNVPCAPTTSRPRLQAITFPAAHQRLDGCAPYTATIQYTRPDHRNHSQDAAENGWHNSTRTLYWYETLPIITSTQRPPLTGVRLFPNPATESFTVEMPTANATITRLQLYDMQGRLWLQQSFRSSNQQITLPGHLPEGIYIVPSRKRQWAGKLATSGSRRKLLIV